MFNALLAIDLLIVLSIEVMDVGHLLMAVLIDLRDEVFNGWAFLIRLNRSLIRSDILGGEITDGMDDRMCQWNYRWNVSIECVNGITD